MALNEMDLAKLIEQEQWVALGVAVGSLIRDRDKLTAERDSYHKEWQMSCAINQAAIDRLAAENDKLKADLAGLEEALELLLLDMKDYEAWQKPCHAYVQAKEALARVRGKGGSK